MSFRPPLEPLINLRDRPSQDILRVLAIDSPQWKFFLNESIWHRAN